MRRTWGIGIVVGTAWLAMNARAAQLDSSTWVVTDKATGKNVAEVTDNNPDTQWQDGGGKGLIVDLGRESVVHRIYVTPGTATNAPITAIRITFLQKPDQTNAPARNYVLPTKCEWWQVRQEQKKLVAAGNDLLPALTGQKEYYPWPLDADVNLKFNPARARYLHIEGPARIAEIEVYGSAEKGAFEKGDAVVVATNAPDLLVAAAEDLRYYIGELTGRPIPIIAPGQEDAYPGTLYRIEDLKPLAGTYEEMVANLKAGKLPSGGPVLDTIVSPYTMRLPDGVNVEKEGRSVVFRAWPHRNVLLSAWEFLRRQGVVWAYPDCHGDFVPAGKGVDLGILPLRYRPSADWRFANCFEFGGRGMYPFTDAGMFLGRSGYDTMPGLQGDPQNEVPPFPQRGTRSAKEVPAEYTEGFDGYPHNFNGVLPNRILEQHPDWCGMGEDGQRKPPNQGGPTFCMTSPGAIEFVANKMLAWIGDNPECMAKFNLLPMDAARYCQCERCLNMYKPYQPPALAWVPISPYSVSDAYYYFVAEVAKRVGEKAPKARIGVLAYADATLPPRKIEKMPANVWVEVCQFGSRNLPMSSPANAAMKECTDTWAKKCPHLTTYEYALIHGEWGIPPMPIPAVSAIVDRSRYLYKLGARNGGTQGWPKSLPHNPWNWYAYPRMLWNINLTVDQILEEFFTVYYREAKVPMLAYYKTLEDYLTWNNIDLQDIAYDQGPAPGMFPADLAATLRGYLAEAEKAAARAPWYVKPRIKIAKDDLEWGIAKSAQRSPDMAVALANGKKSYTCRRRTGTITIDGKLGDAEWKGVAVAGGFVTPGSNQRIVDTEQTEFWLQWDDAKLYVAVKCSNPKMEALKEADAVWGTDNIEWFVLPEQPYRYQGAVIYQMAVSAFNRIFGPKRRWHDQWHADMDWKAEGLETAVQRGDGFWTCEMALPFKALKEGAPKPGDVWRFNICRNGGNGVERAGTWSPLLFGMWHQHHDFNFVVFEGDPVAAAPVTK